MMNTKGKWNIEALGCFPEKYRVVRLLDLAAIDAPGPIEEDDLEIAGQFDEYTAAADLLYELNQKEKLLPWVVNYLVKDEPTGAIGYVTLVYARNIAEAAQRAVYAAMDTHSETAENIFITDIGMGDQSNASLYGSSPLDPLADDEWPA